LNYLGAIVEPVSKEKEVKSIQIHCRNHPDLKANKYKSSLVFRQKNVINGVKKCKKGSFATKKEWASRKMGG